MSGCGLMTDPLKAKDAQWRERPNGATPVFDPGAAMLGTDAEAGGAAAPPPSTTTPPAGSPAGPPMDATPKIGNHDPRLTPRFWLICSLVIVAVLVIAGVASLPGL